MIGAANGRCGGGRTDAASWCTGSPAFAGRMSLRWPPGCAAWCRLRGKPSRTGLMVLLGTDDRVLLRTRGVLRSFWERLDSELAGG